MFSKRRLLVFLVDIALIFGAFSLSFLLRFDFHIPANEYQLYLNGLYVILAVKPLVFFLSGLYKSLWRYASLQDGIELFKVVTLSSVLSAFLVLYLQHFSLYPRSIFFLDWILLFAALATSRLVWRIYRETYIVPKQGTGLNTLIVGAGEAGSLLLKEMRRQIDSNYNIVGFIDDDPYKQGMRLNGVPVLGKIGQLKAAIRKYKIEDVIIAIPSEGARVVRGVVDHCERCSVRFKIVPDIKEIIDGRLKVSQIKDVEIEDLLGRDEAVLEENAVSKYLTGKKVLVTGAGGSIGAELCRQAARFSPSKLILFDNAETPLYHIEKELMERYPELRIIPVIGDIRNMSRVAVLFEEFMPEVVFHAAAYKHVPMMEYNPVEAVTNNILGTRILADVAHRFNVANFVMISTDKAVNPTNIMGATKRTAEIYVQALAAKSATNFTTVRFGNVLGSNGSVVPLFKDQIKAGGPVTVTHPDVIRYFMTIPEAAQLVLQAGCIGTGGEIFVLDMGEPVKIVELAEELIRLSGFVPYEDIDIIFTGLRPGEKLFEELLIGGEGIKPTAHDKIRIAVSMATDIELISREVDILIQKAMAFDVGGIMTHLMQIVQEFNPSYDLSGCVSPVFKQVRPDLFPVTTTVH